MPFSSAEERATVNRVVPGSIPGGAAVGEVALWEQTRLENVAIREGNGSTPLSPVWNVG